MLSQVANVPFTRRINPDSTQDSICMTCFLTVGRGNETDLEKAERNHDCNRSIQAECVGSEQFQYGPV
jgi:hypothetical protein